MDGRQEPPHRISLVFLFCLGSYRNRKSVRILPLGVAQEVIQVQSVLSRGKVNFDKVRQTQHFPPLRPIHFQSATASQGLLTIATAPVPDDPKADTLVSCPTLITKHWVEVLQTL